MRPRSSDDADADGPRGRRRLTADGRPEPSWWHRDHPTFSALTGFFTGLVVVIVVPGAFAAILRAMFDYDTAEDLFPFVLVMLAVPLVLIAVPQDAPVRPLHAARDARHRGRRDRRRGAGASGS